MSKVEGECKYEFCSNRVKNENCCSDINCWCRGVEIYTDFCCSECEEKQEIFESDYLTDMKIIVEESIKINGLSQHVITEKIIDFICELKK